MWSVLGYVLLADGISANPEKVEKVKKILLTPRNAKEVYSLFILTSYYHYFIGHFTNKTQCLHGLIGLVATK